jgi:hypothetical protein
MTEGLGALGSLIDYGGMGLFAIYLIWQRKLDAARLDETMARFAEQSAREETLIRERFDAVVEKYDEERATIYEQISAKLDQLLQHPTTPMPPPPSPPTATETMIERAVTKALKDK